MKKVLKWIGIILASLIGLLVIAVVVMYAMANYRMNRTYDVQVEAIPIHNDEATLERGKYLVENVSVCLECHETDLGGKFFFNDPTIGQIYSSNLTPGTGGVGASYTDEDWVRALRHGVGPDGKPLFVMPAQNFYYYSDEDLGAIIAYLKTFPPVERESPEPQLTFMANILFSLGALGQFPAEIIDHEASRPIAPQRGVTAAYGEYLSYAATCRDCHGPELNGAQAGPGEPYAPNITPGGAVSGWSEEGFINTMRTGVTPTGKHLIKFMPWGSYGRMTDDDLRAIWLYLQSLPALESNPVG
jgi:mono/diheme cytochrome c family protein